MSRIPATYTGLQTALLALLPKDGTPVTVAALAKTLAVSEYQVTTALFDPYLAYEVDFDVLADAYSAPRNPGRPLKPAYSPQFTGAITY